MTIKQTIVDELLDCGDGPVLKQVMDRYAKSKGPLYSALAEATSALRHRLEATHKQNVKMEFQRDSLADQIEALVERQETLEEQVSDLQGKVFEGEIQLGEVYELLERGKLLEQFGFGEEELEQLQGMLSQIADSQEIPAEEAVAQFFETASRFGPLVSLELETRQAETRAADSKGEAERWETLAQQAEEGCNARRSTIDAVERMLDLGISEEDLSHWKNILIGAGKSNEELSASLVQYGSLEALVEARQHKADELQAQTPKLEAQVKSLTTQRDNAGAAVQAVKEKALQEVVEAGNQAAEKIQAVGESAHCLVEALHTTGMSYGDLREEAAALKEYVMVARALPWKTLRFGEHFLTR